MEKSKVFTLKETNRRKRKNQNRNGKNVISRFPYVSSTHKVRLRYRGYDTGAHVASPVWGRSGLLEPLSNVPQFMPSFWNMYKRARIHSSTIQLRLHNLGDEPIELVLNVLPYNWTTGSPTLAEIINRAGSVRGTASVSGGMDRILLSKSVTSKAILGKDAYLSDYDFDSVQAASSTPIANDEPAWTYVITAFNASTAISYRLEFVVEYDIEFYDQEVI